MNNQEKHESRRLSGFYIALCCCVIAVGVAGYFTERANNSSPDTEITGGSMFADDRGSDSVLPQPEIVAENQNGAVAVNGTAENVEDTEIYVEPQSENDADSAAADAPQVIYEDLTANAEAEEAAAIFTSPSFSRPADGEILEGFSETLSYNNALCDWRTHNGADFAVDAGGSVSAAADGTVSRISSDAMGEYVVIDHSGGFSTKYCSLSSVEDITEGDSVGAGDVIGIVAESRAENVTDTHLHFEMYRDGEAVDPMEYID